MLSVAPISDVSLGPTFGELPSPVEAEATP